MRPALLLLLSIAIVTPRAATAFERPSENERLSALGNLYEEPENLRRFFRVNDDFFPLPRPGPSDWLTWHHEPGQSFDDYLAGKPNLPDASRQVIYLLPIGYFPEETSPDLEALRAYTAAFFQMKTRILPAYRSSESEFAPRKNPETSQTQWLTGAVLKFLESELPADGYCILGLTMTDLYPDPSWNYVFGQASIDDRVGIHSLIRYDPAFEGNERGKNYRDIILQRSCKVLAHEIGHLLGLRHCIYFSCVMNGGNHLAEADAAPQHLCPICLRKLHHTVHCDPAERYRDLAHFYREHRWFDDFDFCCRQLEFAHANLEPGQTKIARPDFPPARRKP